MDVNEKIDALIRDVIEWAVPASLNPPPQKFAPTCEVGEAAAILQGDKVSLPPHTKPEQRGNPLEWCERCQLEAKAHEKTSVSNHQSASAEHPT